MKNENGSEAVRFNTYHFVGYIVVHSCCCKFEQKKKQYKK